MLKPSLDTADDYLLREHFPRGINVPTIAERSINLERTRAHIAKLSQSRFVALVVSSDPLRRQNLMRRLRNFGASTTIEASTHAEARLNAHSDGPHDLALIDGTAGETPISPLISDLRSLGWKRVVVLTNRSDRAAVRSALKANIRAFVVAPRNGVRYHSAGNPGIPSQRTPGRGIPDELSSREIEVIRAVSDGHSNKQIGEELGLSALTVKSHLARIARKLGTGDRAEMVAMAMRAGFVH